MRSKKELEGESQESAEDILSKMAITFQPIPTNCTYEIQSEMQTSCR